MVATLDVVLRNDTGASQLYAHVTGSDAAGLLLLRADGRTLYHPASPGGTLQPVGVDCAIAVGPSGSTRTISVPRMASARIWFCKDQPLTFFINPGPALVEPSATNPSDVNYNLDWAFCEFTWNDQQLYANLSFVDFVGLPVSLRLQTGDGSIKSVLGLPSNGLDQVCAKLEAQGRVDGKGWEKLVIRSPASGAALRALSPNAGSVLVPGLFTGYYQSYVDAVWAKYAAKDLTVNTQFTWGDVKGRVGKDGRLAFAGVGSFGKPAAADIFSCSSGPFASGQGVSLEMLNLGARIAAAFNRSTLLINAVQPEGEKVSTYYQNAVTNHYSRICHETSIASRGYAFPYDDVGPAGGSDQSGFVNDPNPQLLTIGVGKPL
ncbi:Glucan endo-1,3-beta-glucosidase [Tolypocladium ophioglossoides CBS 100239]|uniref:Glucan endo-1,3-beta-glucosidase n=1 Tax=Tolypocladium ophioglossoides (strain CBS 100239) TaxID=1163406 RepID=A0A0L0NFH1_TOLOC|nr:Glucan endo-1,3-beta-glucosidase [Tolypocladium ophioglossoides CBS 100239]